MKSYGLNIADLRIQLDSFSRNFVLNSSELDVQWKEPFKLFIQTQLRGTDQTKNIQTLASRSNVPVTTLYNLMAKAHYEWEEHLRTFKKTQR
ncbi:hypothetical protein JGY68_002155 [Salmonella enterica]|nr:hypothetical protein [Salmonella enterica]EEI3459146.1 hypothetical protein [Salmonella enterica subsp. salamae]EGH5309454.1 hypothetical protein [Salmonella enterica]EGW8385411.1 hypothetical protein [Salmonella enterica]EHL2428957.1 hypothetical protein [Salmonella enterica]